MSARLIVKHKVADFANWKKVFDSMQEIRYSYGWIGHELYRDPIDPNVVMVVNKVKTLDGAKAYGASPELKEGMQKAGVISQPEISILSEEEVKEY